MASRLDDAKPLSEPMLEYCYLDHWEHTSVKSYSKFYIFAQENSFENIDWKMVAILSFSLNLLNHKPGPNMATILLLSHR